MLDLARPARAMVPEFRRELDRLFEGFFGPETFLNGVRPFPAVNVWEDRERVYLEAEVPGLTMEDLELTIQGNELSIRGMRRPANGEKVVYHRQERGAGEFARFLSLPIEVDAERVEASLRDGVLTVCMPKAEQAKARKINVKAT